MFVLRSHPSPLSPQFHLKTQRPFNLPHPPSAIMIKNMFAPFTVINVTSVSPEPPSSPDWGAKVVMWLYKGQSCEAETAVSSCAGSCAQLQNLKEKLKQKNVFQER